jgi:PEGA domain-containing protein
VALILVTLVLGTVWFFLRWQAPHPEPAGSLSARATGSVRSAGKATPGPGTGSSRSSRPRATAEPARPGLGVEADVPDADVFVDRVYKGKAPLVLTDVAPGPHRINVSAEGYDGYAETVEVTGGSQTVSVRFKPVRLAASLEVVHKHGIGSCRGRLSATPAGLRYAATKGDDGFDVPLASVERLEADYLKKQLTVKLRGGRTYNFTEPGGSADALVSFQQAVARAQSRQAAAGAK